MLCLIIINCLLSLTHSILQLLILSDKLLDLQLTALQSTFLVFGDSLGLGVQRLYVGQVL